MKAILLTLMVLLTFVSIQAQPRLKPYQEVYSIKDDANIKPRIKSGNIELPTGYYNLMPQGSEIVVPFPPNFVDYATNGNSLQMIIVRGDTVIIGVNYVDSLEANNINSGTTARILYNISYDRGQTWETPSGLPLSSFKSRWPGLSLATISGSRTVLTGGRFYDAGFSINRMGGVSYDALLGLGSPDVTRLPGSVDVFTTLLGNNSVGCIYSGAAGDSIIFRTFNTATHVFGPRTHLFTYPGLSSTICSYTIGASESGNHLAAAYNYINEPLSGGDALRSIRAQYSIDGGSTWSSVEKIAGTGVINGDSCQPYWHEDIAFRPGTAIPYIVFSTFDYTYTIDPNVTRKTWKIVIQSSAINGGNPVVVADYRNIPILNNLTEYSNLVDAMAFRGHTSYQVNSAFLSHPSIGFSDDGNTIYVAYSVIQKDTSTIGIDGRYYHYFDVYLAKSTNGGLTWATKNITETPNRDEMYPVVSERGNDNFNAHVTYHATSMPGSQNFGSDYNPQSPTARVMQIYQKVEPPFFTEVSNTEISAQYNLSQNFPNPFNPVTEINYEVPVKSLVMLRIFDIAGKEITTLVNDFKQSGSYSISFDGSGLSSGVYFYRIEAGDFVQTRKMVLVK